MSSVSRSFEPSEQCDTAIFAALVTRACRGSANTTGKHASTNNVYAQPFRATHITHSRTQRFASISDTVAQGVDRAQTFYCSDAVVSEVVGVVQTSPGSNDEPLDPLHSTHSMHEYIFCICAPTTAALPPSGRTTQWACLSLSKRSKVRMRNSAELRLEACIWYMFTHRGPRQR